jgi:hygromycin-B 4-O-kinase
VERPAVDLLAAAEFLAHRFGGRATDVVAAPRQGEWSRAYFFRHDDADFVVRFARMADNFEKDRAVGRYASRDLPIPRVTEIGEANGCSYAISERAFGSILETLGADEMRRVVPSLFGALDAMRVADVSESTGYGPWPGDGDAEHPTWREYLLSVDIDPPSSATHGWRAKLAARPDDERAFDATCDQLRSALPACPEIRHLVHSDLLYGNVLVAGDQISAVFDWGCALVGDFLYDLAWLTFWAPWYPGLAAIDLRTEALRHFETIGLDVPEFDARLHAYEVHIGLAGQAYQALTERWVEFDAAARRIGQILES